ncbi:MAG: carboxypeptidase regulatory-like domain-containing protein [Planctomycetes bacterium]|nr:carboxypeptidase regulatory-like domain-containing protein [Planctomycetota bacterium]
MKRILLALALGAVATFIVLLVVQLGGEPARTATPDSAAHAATAGPSRALGTTEPVAAAASLAAPTAEGAQRAEAQPSASIDTRPRLPLEGRVAPPPGCAADPLAEVVALGSPGDLDGVLRLLDTGARRRPRQPNPFGPDPEPVAEPATGGILGRAPVAADGTFRLELPPGTPEAHLVVVGRSWHGHATERVDVAAGGRVALVAYCGAWIEGVARAPAGRDVSELEGLEIALETSPDSLTGGMQTFQAARREARVAGGRFEFRALAPDFVYELSALPERLAAASAKAAGLVAGRGTPLEIAFARGGSVRGRVLDEAGGPVAGATVRATQAGRWFGFDDKTVRRATSGADGAFELAAVAAGPAQVTAEAQGRLADKPRKVEVVDGGSIEGVELVLGVGGTIAGAVRWADGRPGAALIVDVSFDMTQMAGMGAFNARKGAKGSAQTDAEGRFRVTGLGPGPFLVEARALPPGESEGPGAPAGAARRAREHTARVGLVKPGTEGLELVLRAPSGVRGRVTDLSGAPVTAFRAVIGGVGEGLLAELGQERRDERFEHQNGEFLLAGLHAGKWKLHVEALGFAPSEPVELVLPLAEGSEPLAFALERAATVRGTVRAPDGSPVTGAKVEIDDGNPPWMRQISSLKPPEAISSDGGAFELSGVKAGRVALRASHADHARSAPLTLELAPGQVVEGAQLALLVGGRITGEVYHEGQPAPGMMIQVQDMKTFVQRMTRSDERGRFEAAHLDAGHYQVVAMPASAAGMSGADGEFDQAALLANLKLATAEVADGGEAHVVLGAPPEDPVQVTGRVTMAGAPVANATVMFLPEGSKQGLAGLKPVTTRSDGTFAVTLDGPGAYGVSVQRYDAQMTSQSVHEERRVVPETETFVLDVLLPEGRISGRVLGPEGNPAANVRVSVTREGVGRPGTTWGGQFHELRTGSDGTYDATGLPSGTYTVLAGGSELGGMLGDASNVVGGRAARGGIELGEREWRSGVDFRLKPPGSVEVLAVDDAGRPVPGAVVFARDEAGRPVDAFSFVTTDSTGRAKYAGLAAGRYTFRARTEALTSVESPAVRVEEGAQTELRLSLEKGTLVLVKVIDAAKAPLPASIEVLDEGGRNLAGQLGLSEIMARFQGGGFDPLEQRFGPFPPGKYRVRATLESGQTAMKPVTLSGQAERKLTLSFD